MDSKPIKKRHYILPVLSILIFIVLWILLSMPEDSMIPAPLETWNKFIDICIHPISKAILIVHI